MGSALAAFPRERARPRLFLALGVDASLHAPLQEAQEALDRTGARVDRERAADFHLTLRFLDRPEPEVVRDLSERLRRLAQGVRPFRLQLRGLGSFPFRGGGAPRVVWADPVADRKAMEGLAEAIEAECAGVGLPPPDFAFHPHVTLGRARSPADGARLAPELERHRDREFGEVRVEAFSLYRSPGGGAPYEIVETFALGGGEAR